MINLIMYLYKISKHLFNKIKISKYKSNFIYLNFDWRKNF